MDGVDKFVQGVGKAIDKVPEVYDDGLKPATKESGKLLALIPQTINAALAPLRQWKGFQYHRNRRRCNDKG